MVILEIWKDIKGYEGLYEVSNYGRIRSKEGKTTYTEKHGVRRWKSRILKQKKDKLGYFRVCLWKEGKPKDFLVHRLVAIAFIGNPPQDKQLINHKDGQPGNNFFENLEWCNHRHNLIHAYKHKMNQAPNGIILTCKESGEETFFYSMAEASRFMGRGHGYISNSLKSGKSENKTHKFKKAH